MFNLFSKREILPAKENPEQQMVAEIHKEFDTAEDRLLEQANNLLRELDIPTETEIELRATKLKALGFVNSETVVKASKLSEHREKQKITLVSTKQQAELIKYYKRTYPFQKFLTETELERICDKYNLIFAPVSNYIKDVPQKNIKEIESIPILKDGDGLSNRKLLKITEFWGSVSREIKDKLQGVLDLSDLSDYEFGRLLYGGGDEILKKKYEIVSSSYIFIRAQLVEENKQGLFIAAPQSHFDLSNLKQTSRHSYLKVTTTEVKDPIVFRYVRGGIQVLSKWGLEASDETLVNEINN